ncbi:MAG: hypothetical protein HY261_00060 [Chloroflexi bacterium]|nr:hypothetical protein [Chloroflexota bacterium]
MGFTTIPKAGAVFFFSSWIVMIFWGIVAPDVGVKTISYVKAMVVTIGLWLAVVPLIGAAVASKRKRHGVWRTWVWDWGNDD